MSRYLLLFFSSLFLSAAAANHLNAQCTYKGFKVLAKDRIGIRCKELGTNLPHVTDGLPQNPKPKVGDATITSSGAPSVTLSAIVRSNKNNPTWLSVELAPGSQLQPATLYTVAITLVANPPSPATQIPPIGIDTTSSYTVTPAFSASYPDLFAFESSTVALEMSSSVACNLMATTSDLPSHKVSLKSCVLESKSLPDWEYVGIVKVRLQKTPVSPTIPDSLSGPTDVFGVQPSIPPTSRMSPINAPASKAAAAYYFNLAFLGATGASPSWSLDAQVIPSLVPGLYGGFEINPFVGSANVGQGSVPTATFTDTINLGSNVVRTFETRKNKLLDSWVLTPGFNSETDKEFDTWNVLGTVDAKFNFRGTNNTQFRQQLQELSNRIMSHPTQAWTISDIPVKKYGYLFEAHALLEGGKKVGASTVQNSDQSASLALPEYPILRPGVQLHGLLQWYRLSADYVVTGRYLVLTEDSVLEHKDKSLYLYQFHGGKAFQVLTGSYQVDHVGHWALSLTYNNGFSPPTFGRTNSVQVGLLVKY